VRKKDDKALAALPLGKFLLAPEVECVAEQLQYTDYVTVW